MLISPGPECKGRPGARGERAGAGSFGLGVAGDDSHSPQNPAARKAFRELQRKNGPGVPHTEAAKLHLLGDIYREEMRALKPKAFTLVPVPPNTKEAPARGGTN